MTKRCRICGETKPIEEFYRTSGNRCKPCQMAARQDYRCALCGAEDEQPPYVDHIKGTKTVRGLLCNPCNRGIGLLKHDPATLAAAVDYVSQAG